MNLCVIVLSICAISELGLIAGVLLFTAGPLGRDQSDEDEKE